jgi:hypothetical protein
MIVYTNRRHCIAICCWTWSRPSAWWSSTPSPSRSASTDSHYSTQTVRTVCATVTSQNYIAPSHLLLAKCAPPNHFTPNTIAPHRPNPTRHHVPPPPPPCRARVLPQRQQRAFPKPRHRQGQHTDAIARGQQRGGVEPPLATEGVPDLGRPARCPRRQGQDRQDGTAREGCLGLGTESRGGEGERGGIMCPCLLSCRGALLQRPFCGCWNPLKLNNRKMNIRRTSAK